MTLKSIYKSIIFAGTFLMLLTPLVIKRELYFPFISSKALYFMAMVQVIFFVWILLMLQDKSYRPTRNVLVISVSLFILILTISSFLGVDPSRSFWSNNERVSGLLMHFHLFALFIVSSSVFIKKEWKWILSFSCIVASIVSVISLYDRFVGIESINFSGGSTLGNTSFLGTYLLFNVFIAVYIFFKNKIVGISTFVLISLGLILNIRGRAALFSFVIGLIISFLVFLFLSKKGPLKILSGIGLVSFVFAGAFGLFVMLQPESNFTSDLLERFNMGTVGGRTVVWEIAQNGFLDRPFLGWGPENFEIVFNKYYNPCFGTERCGADLRYDRAHNIFFDKLVESGVIGLFSFLIVFASAILILYRKREIKSVSIFSGLFAAYFIQGLTVFDIVSSLMMIFLILGFIASEDKKEEVRGKKEPNYFLSFFIIIIFILTLNLFVTSPYKSSLSIVKALHISFETEEKIDFYERSLSTSFSKYQTREHFSSRLKDYVIVGEISSYDNIFRELDFLISEQEKSIKSSPLDYRSHLSLGSLYDSYFIALALESVSKEEEVSSIAKEKLDEAEEYLLKAIELSPKNQSTYWELANVNVRKKDFDSALFLTEKAVELEPKMFNSHLYTLKIAKEILKDEELVREKIERAIEINPDWEEVLKEMYLKD